MSDNLTKARVAKLIAEIQKSGVTVPDEILSIEDYSEKEARLKEFKVLTKKNEGLPGYEEFQTDQEAAANINAVVEARMKALEDMVKRQDEMLRKFAMESSETAKMGLMNEEYIPIDDVLDTPKVYYTPAPSHNIWGKKVGAHWVPVPFTNGKPIKFKQAWGWVTREGDALRQKRIATYECRSKSIADFLESTPEFGRVFFLNMDEAMENSTDLQYAQVHGKHFAALRNKNLSQLTILAKEKGLSTSVERSADDYAGLLADIFAKEEIESQRRKFELAVKQQGIKDMIAQPR